MADKKEFVTSLVVEADDAQVAKLRDTLQQVSNLITGIQSRGAIGGGMGGGGAGGAGGGGGSGGGGGGGGGARGSDGGGGSGGGGGGGGGGGSGGTPPPAGQGGPKQYGVGLAQVATQQDEGVLSSAAAALPSPLPLLGVALGAVAGAAVSATLARGRQFLEFDRQRAATMGLFAHERPDGKVAGRAPAVGAGASLGFMPGETQSLAQAMAQSGLSADELFGLARVPSAFGPYSFKRGPDSLFQAGLLAERAGIGAGSITDFLGMFRPGGGGASAYGMGVPGITDPMRMENALGVAIGAALRAGLQNADVPKYLARIAGATTAMADKGVSVDPNSFSLAAERLAQMSGRSQRGAADMAQTTHLADIARQVSEGGGDPMMQYLFRKATGAGEPGVTPLDVDIRLQSDPAGMGQRVIDDLRAAVAGDPEKAGAVAHAWAARLGMGAEVLYEKLIGPGGGSRTNEQIMLDFARYGSEQLRERGNAGVGEFMPQEALIEARKIASGREAARAALRARELITGLTNDIAPKVGRGLNKLMDVATGKRKITDVLLDVESDYQERTFVPDDGSAPVPAPYGRIPKARAIPGHPATKLPDPKKGGASIDIHIIPAPGMEGVFHFFAAMNHGADAAGVPT